VPESLRKLHSQVTGGSNQGKIRLSDPIFDLLVLRGATAKLLPVLTEPG
jgi:hypothetical protein